MMKMVKDLSIQFANLTDEEKVRLFDEIELLIKKEIITENRDNDFHAGSYNAYQKINEIIEYQK